MVFHDINKLASLTNDTQDSGKDATSNNRQLAKVFIRTIGFTTKELIRSVVSPENSLNKGILIPDPIMLSICRGRALQRRTAMHTV